MSEELDLSPGVLCYHHVGSAPWETQYPGLWISAREFRKDLEKQLQSGLLPCTLGETLESGHGPRFAVTLDDGLESAFQHATPILHELKISATQFLVADRIGQINTWDTFHGETSPRLMDQSQIREWLAAGQTIGGHTCTHRHLPDLDLEEARREIGDCKAKLEDLFQIPVLDFAYPYGDWNPAMASLVQAAGYRAAWTVSPLVEPSPLPRFTLPRQCRIYPRPKWHSGLARALRWVRHPLY